MLPQKKIEESVEYWILNSNEKLKTMRDLYKGKRYADSLYYGHMILEMVLKALVVQKSRKPAPHIHNLSRLVELSEADLGEREMDLLAKVNRFNLESRYPNEKLEFYKICTKSFADGFYEAISNLYKKLCQKAKLKK